MKDILLIGDLIINSKIYTRESIEKILDNEDITYDNMRIDSLLKIDKQYYINQPVYYDIDLVNNIEKYNMIVLSLYTYDLVNGYRKENDVINTYYISLYESIISILKTKCNKLLVVIPHKPYLGVDSNVLWLEEYINNSHTSYINMIKNILKKYTFSILDLNKSIDCKDISNYLYNGLIFLSGDNNIKIAIILIKIKENIHKNYIYKINNV